jgi:hypothetical protein
MILPRCILRDVRLIIGTNKVPTTIYIGGSKPEWGRKLNEVVAKFGETAINEIDLLIQTY